MKPWKKEKLSEAEKAKAASDSKKTIARNKRARWDLEIDDTLEAGLVLSGTEVKSLRAGRASIIDGWVEFQDGEAWLYGVNIPMYTQGSWSNHTPTQKRKLLMHSSQIGSWAQKSAAKGYTVVPLELYFVRGRVKVELGLGRGKKEWDKRQALRERQDEREARRAMSKYLKQPAR